MEVSGIDLIRKGFEDASNGDIDAVATLLAEDVYWGPPGDGEHGCHNRRQALRWMRDGIARGIHVELLDVRELPDGRVLVALQRMLPREGEASLPAPHGQIIRFRDGQITAMVVYPTAAEAEAAARET